MNLWVNWPVKVFFAVAAVLLAIDVAHGFYWTSRHWVFLLVAGGAFLVSIWTRVRGQAKLAELSDEQFLARLAERPLSDELLLAERRRVADRLGLQARRLDPRQTFDQLAGVLDFVGSFWVDLKGLIDELGREAPEAKTVGELVVQLARVRARPKAGAVSPK